MSRAKEIAFKTIIVLGAAVTLVSAVVVSLAFLAVGVAVLLIFGGYFWWKTRDLRRQFRERRQSQTAGDVIEGEVISRDVREDRR